VGPFDGVVLAVVGRVIGEVNFDPSSTVAKK